MSASSRVGTFVAHQLRSRIERFVEDRLHTAVLAMDDVAAARRKAAHVDARLSALEDRLEQIRRDQDGQSGPFRPDMTVAQAWRRHPQTRLVFARRHLPDCDGCAVRHDEVLWEVAESYGFAIEPFLEELNALLGCPPRPTDRPPAG